MRNLWPQIHSWWLLWLAAVITMTIVAASQLFTDRIGQLLDHQASELLAADMLVTSSEKLPESFTALAQQYKLSTAKIVELRSAIFIDDAPQLVEVKAVSRGYPLRGSLELKRDLLSEPRITRSVPERGEVWIDNKLKEELNRSIALGYSNLRASWLISYEPDRGGSLFNLAPRIMMNLQDLSNTGLLTEGSRAKYKLLVAGDPKSLQAFKKAIESRLEDGQKLQSLDNARPEMRNALQRTKKFFSMSITMTLVIAMVAIAITARYAASQESTKVSVMRTFGISSRRLIYYYVWQIGKIWIIATPVGLLMGLVAQYPLQWALGFWFSSSLPDPSWQPFALSGLVGLVSLLGFSLPPLLTVVDTPPMQMLRQLTLKSSSIRSMLFSSIGLVTLYLVLLLIVPDFKMASILYLLIIVIGLFIPAVLRLFLYLYSKIGQQHFWLKSYALTRLLSYNRNAIFVMSGFSLTLLSVLLISLVKDQLIHEWETQLPEDKPNYFLVNIPTTDVDRLSSFLKDKEISSSGAYALVRARLKSINEQDIKQIKFDSERGQHLSNHVFNISYSDTLPVDNEVVEGDWLGQKTDGKEFSVEQGMAESMGLNLGDTLKFSVAGEIFEGQVSSIRSVVWENFQPNFYLIGTQKELADKPQTWLMSALIKPDQKPFLKTLIQKFPSVTLLDISEVMQRVKGIINRASLALQFFFMFAILAAVIVLLSALNTANKDRQMEIALLQSLGATNRDKLFSQVFEFVLMGLVVGFFAAVFSTLTGYIVGAYLFDLSFVLKPEIWLYSISIAVVSITVLGTLFIYRSFNISPMSLLRS
jgi:putative ABC transport system permease protein